MRSDQKLSFSLALLAGVLLLVSGCGFVRSTWKPSPLPQPEEGKIVKVLACYHPLFRPEIRERVDAAFANDPNVQLTSAMTASAGTHKLRAAGRTEQGESQYNSPCGGGGLGPESVYVITLEQEAVVDIETMPLEETLSIQETLDEIRRQWGLKYPTE